MFPVVGGCWFGGLLRVEALLLETIPKQIGRAIFYRKHLLLDAFPVALPLFLCFPLAPQVLADLAAEHLQTALGEEKTDAYTPSDVI